MWIKCTHRGCDEEYEYDYRITPGEPMVRYYADGSGHPGSGPEVEVTESEFTGDVAPCGHAQDWDVVTEEILDRADVWARED